MGIFETMKLALFENALIAAVLVGGTVSLLSVVVVVFQLTTIRFALMHVALLGGAIGLVIQLEIMIAAMVAIIIGSILLGPISTKLKVDMSLLSPVIMTGSLGIAFMLLYVTGIPAMDIYNLFTGSILSVTQLDLVVIMILSLSIIVMYTVCYREIQLTFYHFEQAEWLGVPAQLIKNIMIFLTGISIGVLMKIVGALLIDVLILIPALVAVRLATGLFQLLMISSFVGLITSFGGLVLAILFDLPVGATMTIISICLLGLSVMVKR